MKKKKELTPDEKKEQIYVSLSNKCLSAIKLIENKLNEPGGEYEARNGVTIPIGAVGENKENGFILFVGIIPASQMEIPKKKEIEVIERPKLIKLYGN